MGIEAYRDRLARIFPEERTGLAHFFRFLSQIDHFLSRIGEAEELEGSTGDVLVGKLSAAASVLRRDSMVLRYARYTLQALLDRLVRDPRLRSVLSCHHHNYAFSPAKISAVVHGAAMVGNLRRGTYYPRGGGKAIIAQLVRIIEEHGGEVIPRARAERIRVERGRVVGVDYRRGAGVETELRCANVVSNADIRQTLERLVEPRHLKRRTLRRSLRFQMSHSLFVVYLGVKLDPRACGLENKAYYLFPYYDHQALYRTLAAGELPEAPYVFACLTSLRDPDNRDMAPPGVVNMQLMTLAPSQPEAWGVTPAQVSDGSYRAVPEYKRRKREFADRLIEETTRLIPGIRDAIVFQEAASPLTQARYTGATDGAVFGLACTPGQFFFRPGAKTEIDGLYLAGASTKSAHGINGAMRSGCLAAAAVIRDSCRS